MLDLVNFTENIDCLKETCEWLINELMRQEGTEWNYAEKDEGTDEREILISYA